MIKGVKNVAVKGISKFDFETFRGGYDDFAASQQKYSKQEAAELYKREHMIEDSPCVVMVGEAWVWHGIGWDSDAGEKAHGWWLSYVETERSCPVWCMHAASIYREEKRTSHQE